MTPTQAQIEAAAKGLHRFEVEHGYISSETALASDQTYKAMAKAALTAAAEVGNVFDNSTAEQVEARWEKCFKDAADNIRRKERERCAQVLDDAAAKATLAFWADELRRLAAAIRALDKP